MINFNPHASCEARRADLAREIKEAVDNLTDENAVKVLEIVQTFLRIQRVQRLRRRSST